MNLLLWLLAESSVPPGEEESKSESLPRGCFPDRVLRCFPGSAANELPFSDRENVAVARYGVGGNPAELLKPPAVAASPRASAGAKGQRGKDERVRACPRVLLSVCVWGGEGGRGTHDCVQARVPGGARTCVVTGGHARVPCSARVTWRGGGPGGGE